MRNWYCEHGQISGTFRKKVLKIDTQKPNNLILDTLRAPDKYANEVFMRDAYTCQYCNMRVLPKEIFAIYSKIVGAHIFKATGTNNERHGIVLAFRANADHVIPWTHG